MPWLSPVVWTYRHMCDLGSPENVSSSSGSERAEQKHNVRGIRKCHSMNTKMEEHGTLGAEVWDLCLIPFTAPLYSVALCPSY